MACVLLYHRDTGAIHGVYTSSNPALLDAQRRPEDPALAHLCVETTLLPDELQRRFEVQREQLVAREVVELRATPPTFAADGMAVCVVTVVPFVPCTLVVEARRQVWRVVLKRLDDPLTLTVDTPQVLTIRVEPPRGFWAEPLRVEAT
jgi:hypothetical protein